MAELDVMVRAGSPFLLLLTRTASFVFALAVVISQIARIGIISFKFYTVWCVPGSLRRQHRR